jgi:hypothetical protein
MALAACGAPSQPVACLDYAAAGLDITVRDGSDEHVKPKICDAVVTARDGDYVETLEAPLHSDCSYLGAWERPGTYALTVTRQGFAAATVEEVLVDADECHVITERLTIDLLPE